MAEWDEVFVAPRFQHSQLDNYQPAKGTAGALKACQQYVASYSPDTRTGLLLVGPPGTGKTHLAVATARTIASRGYWPILKVWLSVCDEMRDAFRLKQGTGVINDQLKRNTLLVLDELGAESPADWSAELALTTINYRYERALPTIITSNLSPQQLMNRYGERTSSRLAEMCSVHVLDGPDWRLQQRKVSPA